MGRYNVFIIDDEPMIVKGLVKLVPWEDIQCDVCGTAKNGMEGLADLEALQPDIVISDIRMPKISGLEMIRRYREKSPDTKFILLTSYRDFDYAREAIELGVVKYLLKPTNLEEIKEAIVLTIQVLDEERSKEEDIKELRIRINALMDQQPSLIGLDTMGESSNDMDQEGTGRYLAMQAIQFMKEHYGDKIDLTAVSEQLNISTWYLCKIFKSEFNNSFVQLLNEIRIDKAKELLVGTNDKVYEVAYKVGFLDTPYFTKTFKKHVGVTPNQYRVHSVEKNDKK